MNVKNALLKAAGAAAIPLGTVTGLSEIRISAMRTVVIEAHRGVRSFTGDCVLVETGDGMLCVRGEGLVLNSMSRSELRLTGGIQALELMENHAL